MKEELTLTMQKTATQLAYATEILLEKTRDWQVIREYMCNRLNNVALTETQQQKLKRYQFIYNQLVSGKYTDQEVVHQLMRMYSIQIVQAYEDLNCSREVFNAVINVNKIFEIKMELQIAKDMRRKCNELGDFKAAAAIQKNIIALNAMLPEVEDDSAQHFMGHEIQAIYDPQLLGAPPISSQDIKEVLAAINAKRKVKIKTEMFEHLEFEDGNDKEAAPL